MGFWNRKSEDPLLKLFLEKYGLNLLSIPRENVHVGDLYMYDSNSNRVSSPGSITNFLTPKFEMPPITKDETLADVSGQTSSDVSAKIGLDFLEGFLNALGAVGIRGKLGGAYEKAKDNTMIFGIPSARRDYIDPFLLGSKLIGHKFDVKNALYKEDNQYYVVTAVAKSKSLSIEIKGDEKQSSTVNMEITNITDSSSDLKVQKNQKGRIIYTGDKELGFGVEVYKLQFNSRDGKISMNSQDSSIRVRGSSRLIGDPEGNAFIDVSNL